MLLHTAPMYLQGARERRNRGQQALLQADEGELRERRLMGGKLRNASHAQLAVLPKLPAEHQFRSVTRQVIEHDSFDSAGWKRVPQAAQIGLETANHDRFKFLGFHLNAAFEALRVEHFE